MTETMQTSNLQAHTAYIRFTKHCLMKLQQMFLQELLTKQAEKIKTSAFCLAYEKAKKENGFLTDDQSHFQDLFGLLTASESASVEDMKQAVLQRAKEHFKEPYAGAPGTCLTGEIL